jgi:hypothetical protein
LGRRIEVQTFDPSAARSHEFVLVATIEPAHFRSSWFVFVVPGTRFPPHFE